MTAVLATLSDLQNGPACQGAVAGQGVTVAAAQWQLRCTIEEIPTVAWPLDPRSQTHVCTCCLPCVDIVHVRHRPRHIRVVGYAPSAVLRSYVGLAGAHLPITVQRWSAAVPCWPRCFSQAWPYPVMWGHFASPIAWPTQQTRPRISKVPEAITRARRRWTKSVSISVLFLLTLLVHPRRARVMASR